MELMRTDDLIKALKEQDPEGTRIIHFKIYDIETEEDIAFGEVYKVDCFQKNARQTDEGDRDILSVNISLETDI